MGMIRIEKKISAEEEQTYVLIEQAIREKNIKRLKQLIEETKVDINANFPHLFNMTPLVLACSLGYIEGIRYLLDKGVNVNANVVVSCTGGVREVNYLYPIHSAIDSGSIEAVRLIVYSGANLNIWVGQDSERKFLSEYINKDSITKEIKDFITQALKLDQAIDYNKDRVDIETIKYFINNGNDSVVDNKLFIFGNIQSNLKEFLERLIGRTEFIEKMVDLSNRLDNQACIKDEKNLVEVQSLATKLENCREVYDLICDYFNKSLDQSNAHLSLEASSCKLVDYYKDISIISLNMVILIDKINDILKSINICLKEEKSHETMSTSSYGNSAFSQSYLTYRDQVTVMKEDQQKCK